MSLPEPDRSRPTQASTTRVTSRTFEYNVDLAAGGISGCGADPTG
jgi:hypothetical protein